MKNKNQLELPLDLPKDKKTPRSVLEPRVSEGKIMSGTELKDSIVQDPNVLSRINDDSYYLVETDGCVTEL